MKKCIFKLVYVWCSCFLPLLIFTNINRIEYVNAINMNLVNSQCIATISMLPNIYLEAAISSAFITVFVLVALYKEEIRKFVYDWQTKNLENTR